MNDFIALLLVSLLGVNGLDGVIDLHAHTDPDSLPRSIDAIDLARVARSRGLAAFLEALRASGFTEAELNGMSKSLPAKLLGLP